MSWKPNKQSYFLQLYIFYWEKNKGLWPSKAGIHPQTKCKNPINLKVSNWSRCTQTHVKTLKVSNWKLTGNQTHCNFSSYRSHGGRQACIYIYNFPWVDWPRYDQSWSSSFHYPEELRDHVIVSKTITSCIYFLWSKTKWKHEHVDTTIAYSIVTLCSYTWTTSIVVLQISICFSACVDLLEIMLLIDDILICSNHLD